MPTKKTPPTPTTDRADRRRAKAQAAWVNLVRPITDWIDSNPAQALQIFDLFKEYSRAIDRIAPFGASTPGARLRPRASAPVVGGSMSDYLRPSDADLRILAARKSTKRGRKAN